MDNNQKMIGTVTSKDGTAIGYTRLGSGPAIVVTHGSFDSQQGWLAFARLLAATHTVYVYDRRGRGQSPDVGKPYSFQFELDDLAAMVALAGPDTALLGHSFGGGTVLAYTIREGFTGRIILYEPINSILRQLSGGHYAHLQALVDQGRLDEATAFGMEQVVGLPAAQVALARQSRGWLQSVERVSAFAREIAALDELSPSEAETDAIRARAFVLLGTFTALIPIRVAAAGVAARVRGLTLYPIVNQGHFAHYENPEQLRQLVVRCLTEA
ncbi:MAG: alpha/beta fold hydrolase [Janthinobacterium lividum]